MNGYEYAYNRTPVECGDWIRIPWMEGEPIAEVLSIDELGYPVVEHPRTPGIGPMTVDVFDLYRRADDPVLFGHGDGI